MASYLYWILHKVSDSNKIILSTVVFDFPFVPVIFFVCSIIISEAEASNTQKINVNVYYKFLFFLNFPTVAMPWSEWHKNLIPAPLKPQDRQQARGDRQARYQR